MCIPVIITTCMCSLLAKKVNVLSYWFVFAVNQVTIVLPTVGCNAASKLHKNQMISSKSRHGSVLLNWRTLLGVIRWCKYCMKREILGRTIVRLRFDLKSSSLLIIRPLKVDYLVCAHSWL